MDYSLEGNLSFSYISLFGSHIYFVIFQSFLGNASEFSDLFFPSEVLTSEFFS